MNKVHKITKPAPKNRKQAAPAAPAMRSGRPIPTANPTQTIPKGLW